MTLKMVKNTTKNYMEVTNENTLYHSYIRNNQNNSHTFVVQNSKMKLPKNWNEIIQQAKEMEKQQIMQSYNDGKFAVINLSQNKSLEQYYNKNYGGSK